MELPQKLLSMGEGGSLSFVAKLGHLRAVDVHVVWVLFALAQLCPVLKNVKQLKTNIRFDTNLAVDVVVVTFVLALVARNRAAHQHPVAQTI